MKYRRPWLAILLSLSYPNAALGQLYNGQFKKGLLFASTFSFIFPLCLLFASRTPAGLFTLVGIWIVLWLFIVLDAGISASRIQSISLSRFHRWYGYLFAIVAATVLTSATMHLQKRIGFASFRLSSNGMAPTIIKGDIVLTERFNADSSALKNGDILVINRPLDPQNHDVLMKVITRVVALPGDTVEVKGNTLLRNGNVVTEGYATWRKGGINDFAEKKVPPEKIFCLGDNRDESKDSRSYEDPFLPIETVHAKVLYILWNSHGLLERIGERFDQQ